LVDKCRHAWAVLGFLLEETPNINIFKKELAAVLEIRYWIELQIHESRSKDYKNPFKKNTFRNQEEMEKILGKQNSNQFISIVQEESRLFKEKLERVKARL
jgi:hypothetical protein